MVTLQSSMSYRFSFAESALTSDSTAAVLAILKIVPLFLWWSFCEADVGGKNHSYRVPRGAPLSRVGLSGFLTVSFFCWTTFPMSLLRFSSRFSFFFRTPLSTSFSRSFIRFGLLLISAYSLPTLRQEDTCTHRPHSLWIQGSSGANGTTFA